MHGYSSKNDYSANQDASVNPSIQESFAACVAEILETETANQELQCQVSLEGQVIMQIDLEKNAASINVIDQVCIFFIFTSLLNIFIQFVLTIYFSTDY